MLNVTFTHSGGQSIFQHAAHKSIKYWLSRSAENWKTNFVIYTATWFTKWNHFHESFAFPRSSCCCVDLSLCNLLLQMRWDVAICWTLVQHWAASACTGYEAKECTDIYLFVCTYNRTAHSIILIILCCETAKHIKSKYPFFHIPLDAIPPSPDNTTKFWVCQWIFICAS